MARTGASVSGVRADVERLSSWLSWMEQCLVGISRLTATAAPLSIRQSGDSVDADPTSGFREAAFTGAANGKYTEPHLGGRPSRSCRPPKPGEACIAVRLRSLLARSRQSADGPVPDGRTKNAPNVCYRESDQARCSSIRPRRLHSWSRPSVWILLVRNEGDYFVINHQLGDTFRWPSVFYLYFPIV